MKLKNLLMSSFYALLAAVVIVGCNENPVDEPDPGDEVGKVTNLMATSLSATSVGLKWNASATADVTYTVMWQAGAGATSMSADAGTATSFEVTGLTNGTEYTFSVYAKNADGDSSTVETINWAPASRFTNDAVSNSTIRLYARSVSGKGSGVWIQNTGATTVLTSTANTTSLDKFQLLADITSSSIKIGAPKSFSDFTNVGTFRGDVEIADDFEELSPAVGLNGWYMEDDLTSLFTGNNTGQYTMGDKLPDGNGAAFAIRWNASGQMRYAKVFIVPGANGNLVQFDSGSDPYIEIRISFQTIPGLPYAKR